MKNNFSDKINKAGYDSYDPDYFGDVQMDRYDPDYATGKPGAAAPGQASTAVQAARPGQKLQINLTLQNPTAVKLTFELFSALNNWTTSLKADLVVGAFTMIPALSTEGLPTPGVGTVGFDQNGDLQVYGAAPPSASIGCGEYPYNSLVESTKVLPFKCVFARVAVQTDVQLNNQIIHFTRTFGGGYKQNQINVRAFKKPTQFQNLEVDVLAPFVIDAEQGLRYALEVGEVVQLGLFINRWTRPTV